MIPPTQRALILTQIGNPLRLTIDHPTPQVSPGSAIVKVLCTSLLAYSRDIYNGARKYTLPTPSIPGGAAVGRVVAVGEDATALQAGDLVLCDIYIRGRDNRSVGSLVGVHDGHTLAAKKMIHECWRDGTFAEYVKLPLENVFKLNEHRLLGSNAEVGELGYSVEELLHMGSFMVPYSGLRDIGLEVAETVLIAPATGVFGSAAVGIALAMGANVIAMGRNNEALQELKRLHGGDSVKSTARHSGGRLETVRITNDIQQETEAIDSLRMPVDVYFDISPPTASQSTHLRSAILSVRHGGRISLMGGIEGDIPIPLALVMHRNMTIKGRWMYEREDVLRLIRMVESGRLSLASSRGSVKKFGLEQWEEAMEVAAKEAGPSRLIVLIPSKTA